MKKTIALIGMIALLAVSSAFGAEQNTAAESTAATITSSDGVLSIEVPGVRVVPCDYLWSRPHGVYYHDENFSPLLKIFLNELKNSVPSGPRGGGNEIKNV